MKQWIVLFTSFPIQMYIFQPNNNMLSMRVQRVRLPFRFESIYIEPCIKQLRQEFRTLLSLLEKSQAANEPSSLFSCKKLHMTSSSNHQIHSRITKINHFRRNCEKFYDFYRLITTKMKMDVNGNQSVQRHKILRRWMMK